MAKALKSLRDWAGSTWWKWLLILLPVAVLLFGVALLSLRKGPQERADDIDHDAVVRAMNEQRKREQQLSDVEQERQAAQREADLEAQRRIAEGERLRREGTTEQILEALRKERERKP